MAQVRDAQNSVQPAYRERLCDKVIETKTRVAFGSEYAQPTIPTG
jgi:hypothetical protein